MITTTEAGKRVATPFGAGVIEHHTDGYAGELDYYLVKLDEALEYGVTHVHVTPADVTEEAPEPRSIRFEKATCGRCKGAGRRSDNGWGANHEGICYRCHGAGVALTANGYRANQAYIKLRDERLGAAWGDLAEGDVFWYEGDAYEKGNHPSLVLRAETRVRRHDGPATRQMWREIAKRYKGAELTF